MARGQGHHTLGGGGERGSPCPPQPFPLLFGLRKQATAPLRGAPLTWLSPSVPGPPPPPSQEGRSEKSPPALPISPSSLLWRELQPVCVCGGGSQLFLPRDRFCPERPARAHRPRHPCSSAMQAPTGGPLTPLAWPASTWPGRCLAWGPATTAMTTGRGRGIGGRPGTFWGNCAKPCGEGGACNPDPPSPAPCRALGDPERLRAGAQVTHRREADLR